MEVWCHGEHIHIDPCMRTRYACVCAIVLLVIREQTNNRNKQRMQRYAVQHGTIDVSPRSSRTCKQFIVHGHRFLQTVWLTNKAAYSDRPSYVRMDPSSCWAYMDRFLGPLRHRSPLTAHCSLLTNQYCSCGACAAVLCAPAAGPAGVGVSVAQSRED